MSRKHDIGWAWKPTEPIARVRDLPPRIDRRDKFYESREWIELRYQALRLYGATCQCCGRGAVDKVTINVDHIKSRRDYPELALALSNLQILCSRCNQGKGSWDSTDWRTEEQKQHMRSIMEPS